MNIRLIDKYLKAKLNHGITWNTLRIDRKLDALIKLTNRKENVMDWVRGGKLSQRYELEEDLEYQIKQLKWEELKDEQ